MFDEMCEEQAILSNQCLMISVIDDMICDEMDSHSGML